MFGFLTFGTTLAFTDLAIKSQIETMPSDSFPQDLEGTKGYIRLHKNHNPGFSFGVLKEWPRAVELAPLCMASWLFGVFCCLCGTKKTFFKKLGVIFALAGGVSNLYDRLKRGYVVDYFSIQAGWLKKIVFNLGDLFIILGAFVFSAAELAETLRKKK